MCNILLGIIIGLIIAALIAGYMLWKCPPQDRY